MDRVESVTTDLVQVIEEEAASDQGLEVSTEVASAMLAGAIAHESGLQESAENCKPSGVGDGGRSVGLGQVMNGINWEGHSRTEICSDRKLQLRLSLRVLNRCIGRSPQPEFVFRCYTAGDGGVHSKAARSEYYFFTRILKNINDLKLI